MVVQRYDFEFAGRTDSPEKINTGATMHTRNGLWMKVLPRGGK